MTFVFTPPDGYRNVAEFPTKPGSEAQFRGDMMRLLDQLRDYVNTGLPQKTQEAWIAPTLLNGWVNFGGGFATAGYYKDDMNIVHVRGMVKGGTATNGAVIFNLPVGYRPLLTQFYATTSFAGFGSYSVSNNGEIAINVGNAGDFSINFSFRAE